MLSLRWLFRKYLKFFSFWLMSTKLIWRLCGKCSRGSDLMAAKAWKSAQHSGNFCYLKEKVGICHAKIANWVIWTAHKMGTAKYPLDSTILISILCITPIVFPIRIDKYCVCVISLIWLLDQSYFTFTHVNIVWCKQTNRLDKTWIYFYWRW